MKPIIAYYRVSTKRQGNSGLGLEAQQAAVAAFGGDREVIAAYREIESGRRSNRPELQKALSHARLAGATLVIAKLDRLSRNVAFLSNLMESDVDFVCCDQPTATRFVLHVLAAAAEAEAKATSERTKAALAAARARGTLLGSKRPGHWQGREHLRQAAISKATHAAAEANRNHYRADYSLVIPMVKQARAAGHGLEMIACGLNSLGFKTRRGAAFTAVQIHRLLAS